MTKSSKYATSVTLVFSAAFALSGCSETTGNSNANGSGQQPPASMSSSEPLRTGSPADESACLSAVAAQTGNSVAVLSSEFSQANTLVMVGVGSQQAPWRCLISNGVVAEVMSMTDEGAL